MFEETFWGYGYFQMRELQENAWTESICDALENNFNFTF